MMPIVSCALIAASAALAPAQQPADDRPKADSAEREFIRLARDADQKPVALEVAIVRCAPASPDQRTPTVDLVAAVHVAEKSYYQQLNREFRQYDAVLYELVAPEGTRIPQGGSPGSSSPVSLLQKAVKNVLELEFQLDVVDYTPPNMVHADMSPEQFAGSMQRRGESFLATFMRMLGYALARQQGSGAPTEGQLLVALLDKNRSLALKRVMAGQFERMGGSLAAVEGPDGSTLISERNKVAMEVLRKQMAAGKRRIAIFYGGAHMPDFQQRLRSDLGLVPVNTRWLTAWNLK